MESLCERVGGEEKLKRVVDQFYQFVLADERINHYWVDYVSDIPKIHQNMTCFMVQSLGGPCHYEGKDMYEAHKDMEVKPEEFNIIWDHIENSMLVHHIDRKLIAEVKAIVDKTYDEIFPKK